MLGVGNVGPGLRSPSVTPQLPAGICRKSQSISEPRFPHFHQTETLLKSLLRCLCSAVPLSQPQSSLFPGSEACLCTATFAQWGSRACSTVLHHFLVLYSLSNSFTLPPGCTSQEGRFHEAQQVWPSSMSPPEVQAPSSHTNV